MITKLTPAQNYAKKIISLIDAGDIENISDLIKERPQTLRNAMNMYLYKSLSKSRSKHRVCYKLYI